MIRISNEGESRLVMLHKNEMILSASQVQKLIESAKSKELNLDTTLEISIYPSSSQEAIDKISDRLIQEMKRRGIRSV